MTRNRKLLTQILATKGDIKTFLGVTMKRDVEIEFEKKEKKPEKRVQTFSGSDPDFEKELEAIRFIGRCMRDLRRLEAGLGG